MKQIRLLKTLMLVVLLGAIVSMTSSCDDDDNTTTGKGTLHGVVTDEQGISLSDVVVSVAGMDRTAVSKENGQYSLDNISVGEHTITFKKVGYISVTKVAETSDFDIRNNLELDVSMVQDVGAITGTITDAETGLPIAGATVVSNGETVTSDANGVYAFESFEKGSYTVEFSADGYFPATGSVGTDDFVDRIATLDMQLEPKSVIEGIVTDSESGLALAGVTVKMGDEEVATDVDGKYAFKGLDETDYTLVFSKEGYYDETKTVVAGDFANKLVTLNLAMDANNLTILGNMTAEDLASTRKWRYNVLQGGKNSEDSYHWYQSVNYLLLSDYYGSWEEQNEGTTVRIRNTASDQTNPANLNKFDSFIYGSKAITADNKILSLRMHTKDADAASPAHFGVQVVDLSAMKPTAVKIGETKTYGSSTYTDFSFDLSDYVGKEVIIAVGIYRAQTGDYYKQFVIRSLRFAQTEVIGTAWMPGTEVVTGWKLTQEMVRSTMLNTSTIFTGMSTSSDYRTWLTLNSHVGSEWSAVSLYKEPDVTNGSGYSIKTNTGNGSSIIPHAYIYSKFAITTSNDQMTLKARTDNSGSRPDRETYFKLSVVKEDGTVTHVIPTTATINATDAAAVYATTDRSGGNINGCVRFSNKDGSSSAPEKYAVFEYDLSQFNNSNVVLVLGVYNVVEDTSENKVQIYSIDFK
ncbi:5-hydroxyisourate hydrolase-like protein (transthyretin family) [Dysgonomonas hofstadii]|uniref:5-hydroxyisourate hydrolase-like protein (Transthyretin family) n=1 Tax=Dysgonomonas hofstadii TaxID=637886 RepID=A0A840CJF1_9BACT|nr:carboxypeptidase regulatory-like domain-containing protein [Dysgonomonas hofstadii]MBB4035486.1 5-hydroxyisourate hydrolase-like protein (transthyretin family) [Dysgonomonas hofstadii]